MLFVKCLDFDFDSLRVAFWFEFEVVTFLLHASTTVGDAGPEITWWLFFCGHDLDPKKSSRRRGRTCHNAAGWLWEAVGSIDSLPAQPTRTCVPPPTSRPPLWTQTICHPSTLSSCPSATSCWKGSRQGEEGRGKYTWKYSMIFCDWRSLSTQDYIIGQKFLLTLFY